MTKKEEKKQEGSAGKTVVSELERTVMRVSIVSITVNLLLSVMKLIAGMIASSSAMISDAVHSASDVFSTIIVMIGVHISEKEADDEHPYGHERLECVAAVILAVILAVTGGMIGVSGVKTIVSGAYGSLAVPGITALWAAVLSIVVKEWMYHYTVRAAGRVNSGALKADAWHHRSDALSSVGALAGIVFARMGFPVMDSAASVIICVFILKAAWDIFSDAMDKMVDHACDDETVAAMKALILSQDGVKGINWIKTRLFGTKIYLDVAIYADGSLSLTEAHSIASCVHERIEKTYPNVKHCMVHVDPS
ncbi:MAG: cation diffusion facilitator family transporter [Lachnospiraceae bacterium]|nr:cation diffusion facilitator family transporter [Lachnospiraceae bacterium]